MATRIERTAMPGPESNGKQIEGINARFENDGRTVESAEIDKAGVAEKEAKCMTACDTAGRLSQHHRGQSGTG